MKKFSDFYTTVHVPEGSYFIGANTALGFSRGKACYYDEGELTKLYIIKGGPGTGKSTMMKRCAEEAEKSGASVTRLYCSSDPDSLDGVIIEKGDIRIAIVDGTAPHTADPKLPGCTGEIINCGDAWKTEILEGQRDEIAALSAAKSVAFERAYAFISAAAGIKSTMEKAASDHTNKRKLRAFAARLCAKLPKQKTPAEKSYCITGAVSMKGGVRFDTFDRAKIKIGVYSYAFLSKYFFDILSEEFEKRGHSQLISTSPLGDIFEIYLPECDVLITPAAGEGIYTKAVRLKRFADEKASDGSAKRRFHERFFCELMYAATDALAEAKSHHFALEEIYVSAMDFEKINVIGDKLVSKIKGALR